MTDALVLGLDGATWTILDRFPERLPNLTALKARGAWAQLNSTTPPMTLPSWSSVLTGCRPGMHGILDFTRREPGTYRLGFLNSTHRAVPTLHRVLSDRGGRVASVAVPTTYPPESLNGVVIAGFDSPVATTAESSHCSPAAVWPNLQARFGGLRFADFQEGDIGPGWHVYARDSLLREVGRKEALCAHLLESEPWRLFMVVFGESDTVSHHFWMFFDPDCPRHAEAQRHPDFERLRDTVLDVYARLDAAIGRLATTTRRLMICSDHGFGPANTRALYLNRFLEQAGWLRFRPHSTGDGLRRLALRLPVERVIRRLPNRLLGETETRGRYGPIDFSATRAWSDEMNYAATLHLNIKGRDPRGTVENVPLAIADLRRLLLGWEIDGEPVVDEVVEGAYDGVPGAPDLVLNLSLREGGSSTLLPSTRVPAGVTHRVLEPREHGGGKGLGMNGAHRQMGVFIAAGEGIWPGEVHANVWDLAPTLLAWLGEAVPEHMQGRVLTEALPGVEPKRSQAQALSASPVSRHDAALVKRLEKLGYF